MIPERFGVFCSSCLEPIVNILKPHFDTNAELLRFFIAVESIVALIPSKNKCEANITPS